MAVIQTALLKLNGYVLNGMMWAEYLTYLTTDLKVCKSLKLLIWLYKCVHRCQDFFKLVCIECYQLLFPQGKQFHMKLHLAWR